MANDMALTEVKSQLPKESALVRALADLSILSDDNLRAAVTEHITSIYDVKTPKEKIKRRPDGLDYIESTWMDKTWKGFSPLYEYSLLLHNEALGWIDIIVSLKDRISGNVELGAGSARIQVRRGASEPYSAMDIVDKGNNLKAALTNAIKNAQSRFGVGADVYGKREELKTDEEQERFKVMLSAMKGINSTRAQMFESQWNDLGTDYTEFLNRWQVFIDNSSAKTGESIGNQKTSAADTKKVKF